MGNLGHRTARGVLASGQIVNRVTPGGWVITFPTQVLPSDIDFEVWHAVIRGPGGYFYTYLDDIAYGVGANGRINEYAPASSAMLVLKGQAITFHWSIASGVAPTAWIYLRTPEVGRV